MTEINATTREDLLSKALLKPPYYFPKANEIRMSDELMAYAKPIFIRLCHQRFKKRLAKKVIKRQHLKVDFVVEYNALCWRRVGEVVAGGFMEMMNRPSFSRRIFRVQEIA